MAKTVVLSFALKKLKAARKAARPKVKKDW